MTIPGVSAGSDSSTVFQGFSSAGGGADDHDFLSGLCHGVRGRRKDASAVSLGSTVWLGVSVRTLAAAAALTASQSATRESSRNCLVPRRGFGDDVDRAIFESLEGALRALLGKTRTDDDGDGMLAHELLEEGEPVHAWHFDIQSNDIGYLLRDAIGRDKGIAGRRDELRSLDRTGARR